MKSKDSPDSLSPYDLIGGKKRASSALPAEEFRYLTSKLSLYIDDSQSLDLIEKAFLFAEKCHRNQKRRSGEPYIIHPIAVATILADLRVDLASIIAAILHDVVEDTDTSCEDIEAEFGKVIANLVDGLTKIGKIKFRSTEERMAENFRKMIIAMAKDLRVILIKLADRLHNMRTLSALDLDKRLRISHETLDIYAPLANRLGIYGIKSELEDLCLKQTKNEVYKEIRRKVAAKKDQREAYITEVLQILQTELKKYGFQNAKVYGRPKHFYSIYKKMVDRQLAFEDIHDLFAFRIIVDSIKDCYEALGVIHSMWKPMPGRFKDYIAMPKANLYQSLHTTVIRPNGTPAEIQIRTHEMHSICEIGIAAHWSYKEKTPEPAKSTHSFSWLRQMMELHHDVKDPNEFLDAVKVDLFDEEIFVFTPKGDVIQLAAGATPLDFAFTVHTDIGLSTVGAKVNGKITPLRSRVQSGDIVEIITSNSQTPNKDWLNFVTTSKARNKIRSYLRSEQRQSGRKIGKELLIHELSKRQIDLDKLMDQNKTEALVKAGRESGLDELLIAIGYGKHNPSDLVARAFPPVKPSTPEPEQVDEAREQRDQARSSLKRSAGVLVSGMNSILVSYGKCCNPLPGDQIVGFITRGRGVSIHRNNCARALDLDPARRIEVSWVKDDAPIGEHRAFLTIVTQDRQGILAEITVTISESGANVQRAKVQVAPDMTGTVDFEVTLNSLNQLNRLMSKLEGIQGVILVERKEKKRASKAGKRKRMPPIDEV